MMYGQNDGGKAGLHRDAGIFAGDVRKRLRAAAERKTFGGNSLAGKSWL